MSGSIHIGTSGWSYSDWKGNIYPEGTASKSWLQYYATELFNATELNSSFYRLPQAKTVDNWMAQVPKHFVFCPKMSRYLTQMKKLNEPEEPLERFFKVFEPMKSLLGPVLIQLPPSLGYHEETVRYFFDVLKNQYHPYKFALEVRHESWLEAGPLELMKQYQIAFVISQSKNKFPYAEHVTAKHVYLRLHGPEKLYNSSYSDDDLRYYADLIAGWKSKGHQVFVFFNNTTNGIGANNARTLASMLTK